MLFKFNTSTNTNNWIDINQVVFYDYNTRNVYFSGGAPAVKGVDDNQTYEVAMYMREGSGKSQFYEMKSNTFINKDCIDMFSGVKNLNTGKYTTGLVTTTSDKMQSIQLWSTDTLGLAVLDKLEAEGNVVVISDVNTLNIPQHTHDGFLGSTDIPITNLKYVCCNENSTPQSNEWAFYPLNGEDNITPYDYNNKYYHPILEYWVSEGKAVKLRVFKENESTNKYYYVLLDSILNTERYHSNTNPSEVVKLIINYKDKTFTELSVLDDIKLITDALNLTRVYPEQVGSKLK